jgi:hypothetical protein
MCRETCLRTAASAPSISTTVLLAAGAGITVALALYRQTPP